MSSFYGNIVVNLNEGNTSLSSLQLDNNGNFYGLNEDSQRIAGPFNAVSTGVNIIATLTYKNYDGSQTIATRSFINGIPQSEAPINPFRTATAQYEYSFAGWADNTNQTSGQLSINSLWHDKIVYAAYTATQRSYTVTWKDSNGTVLETDSNVPYGTYPSYDGSTPNYNGQTFKEWSPSISNAITGNTQFVATYYNTYNVYFYSGQTLLDTVTVTEGQNAVYSGTTPTKTGVNDPENYTFSGWDPLPNNIQANTTCYAQFTYTEPVVSAGVITDTWDEIFANTANGTYKTKYNIGDTKELDLGTQGVINMQIIAFDTDDLADGSGKAPITWISKELLATDHRMNPQYSSGTEGTGTLGGWTACEMRSYLKGTIKPLIPSVVANAIKEVTKYTKIYTATPEAAVNDVSSTEDVWIPSRHEMFDGTSQYYETMGPRYGSAFPNDASRIKKKAGAASASWWWLRSAYYTNYFNNVISSGLYNYSHATSVGGIALGFCTGGTPTQTTDITDGAYGVEWDYSNSSPILTRKGLSANFADPSPATSLAGTGSSPFDNIQPWAGMKRYNIIDGAVSYSEDDAGFSETEYDTVVYIPEFYYFASKDTENSKWTWAISPTAKEGYLKHPGSGRYIGRFHTSGSSEGVFSKSGVAPLVNTNRTDFRTYSHNKGSKWWMIDIATWSALQILYLVEFANFNSQDTLGTGYANVTSAIAECGATGAAVYHTLKLSAAHNQYRWVEDPFSNCCDWVDGFTASNRATYVGTDNATFATSSFTATGITLPSSDYISGFGYSEECPWLFIPDAASGDGTTYVTDRVYSNRGMFMLNVGGAYSGGPNYGFFYFNANFSASNTYGYLGSRLLFIP